MTQRNEIDEPADLGITQGLKERLVHIAAGLLAEPRNAKLPTMREIASAAGVAPGAAYRHFESQGELFLAVIAWLFDDLERELNRAAEAAGDSRTAVREFCLAYVSWGLKNPGGYQLLFETTDEPYLLSQDRRPGLHLIDRLAQLIEGRSPAQPANVSIATRVWVSIHGVVSLRLHKTGMPWTSSVEDDIDFVLRSMVS